MSNDDRNKPITQEEDQESLLVLPAKLQMATERLIGCECMLVR